MLTIKQQAFVNTFESDLQEKAKQAIVNGALFADVTVCAFGQYSTGSIELDEEDVVVPCLHLEAQDAEREIKDMQAIYLSDIEEGERDEDDEYEGQLMRVLWNNDDTLSFFTPELIGNDDPIAIRTTDDCCGH